MLRWPDLVTARSEVARQNAAGASTRTMWKSVATESVFATAVTQRPLVTWSTAVGKTSHLTVDRVRLAPLSILAVGLTLPFDQ